MLELMIEKHISKMPTGKLLTTCEQGNQHFEVLQVTSHSMGFFQARQVHILTDVHQDIYSKTIHKENKTHKVYLTHKDKKEEISRKK